MTSNEQTSTSVSTSRTSWFAPWRRQEAEAEALPGDTAPLTEYQLVPVATSQATAILANSNKDSDQNSGDGSSSDSWESIDFEAELPGRNIFQRCRSSKTRKSTFKVKRSWFRQFRLFCGKLVMHDKVQITIVIMIVINGIMLGIGTYPFVTDNYHANLAFEVIDQFFLVVFTIELCLQLVYRLFRFFLDAWLIFDFFIVVSSWSLASLQVFRCFRIFRAFRLVTRIGPLRDLVSLHSVLYKSFIGLTLSIALIQITALGQVMPRLYAIAALMSLVFYIFAVLFTELFGELKLSNNYFGTLDLSLYTCMQMMTLEWADLCREVMLVLPWAWVPFLVFIAFSGFVVFNLIVAVVCDAVKLVDADSRARDKNRTPEELQRERQVLQAEELQKNIGSLKDHQAEMERAISNLMKELTEMDHDVAQARVRKAARKQVYR
jgi:hypothetical protein